MQRDTNLAKWTSKRWRWGEKRKRATEYQYRKKNRKRDFYPPNSIARVLVLFSKKEKKQQQKENSSKLERSKTHFIILVRIIFTFVVNSCNRTSRKAYIFIHYMCTRPFPVPPSLTTLLPNLCFWPRAEKKNAFSFSRAPGRDPSSLVWSDAIGPTCASLCAGVRAMCKSLFFFLPSLPPTPIYPALIIICIV